MTPNGCSGSRNRLKNPESLVFLVTMLHGEPMRLTLMGDEARNCLVTRENAGHACALVHNFINDFYGSFVVKTVDIEGYDLETHGTKQN